MKCPFCNAELEYNIDDAYCPNANCSEYYKEYAPHIWQALIDGKKTQEALDYATEVLANFCIHGYDIKHDTIYGLIEHIKEKQNAELKE